MGMAIYATEAKRVTEELFIIAARALAEQVSEAHLAAGLIYPPQSDILRASLHVAERIATGIFDQGLAGGPRPEEIRAFDRAPPYKPVYFSLTRGGETLCPFRNAPHASTPNSTLDA